MRNYRTDCERWSSGRWRHWRRRPKPPQSRRADRCSETARKDYAPRRRRARATETASASPCRWELHSTLDSSSTWTSSSRTAAVWKRQQLAAEFRRGRQGGRTRPATSGRRLEACRLLCAAELRGLHRWICSITTQICTNTVKILHRTTA